jgi:hypothetical protein
MRTGRRYVEVMWMRALSVTAVSLLAALAFAGAASATSKSEFIRRGDALCTRTLKELAPLRRRAEAAASAPEAKRWSLAASLWSDQIRIQTRFNDRLRAIGTPRGDAAARNLLSRLDRGVVLARRVRDAFAARRVTALATALEAYVDFTLALNDRIRAYGFRVCGGSL